MPSTHLNVMSPINKSNRSKNKLAQEKEKIKKVAQSYLSYIWQILWKNNFQTDQEIVALVLHQTKSRRYIYNKLSSAITKEQDRSEEKSRSYQASNLKKNVSAENIRFG